MRKSVVITLSVRGIGYNLRAALLAIRTLKVLKFLTTPFKKRHLSSALLPLDFEWR